MAEQKYKVIREHIGDKPYVAGDTRVADPGTVGHLVPHVLQPMQGKAAPRLKNKAETELQNKDGGE